MHLGSSMNSILYDAWSQCNEGKWKTSKFYQNILERHTQRRRGVRKWFLEKELVQKFGEALASAIIQRKLDDPDLHCEIRPFPELPDSSAAFFPGEHKSIRYTALDSLGFMIQMPW